MKKVIFMCFMMVFSSAHPQTGINTADPTHTLDVNGKVRVRDLSNSEKKIVIADEFGVLGLLPPEEVFSPKAFLNTSTSSAEQHMTIYEGKCFNPSDNASSCNVKLNHYSSCYGFANPVSTEVIVEQDINQANGQFLGAWSVKYVDNKGYIGGATAAEQVPPDYPRVSYPSSGLANYLGLGYLGGQCNTDLVTTINQTTGNIKIESVKRNMFVHLVYLISISRARSL